MDANRRYGAGSAGRGEDAREGAGYIWLRYSTQFTTGGRTHTIEMEVPVPVGASAELREQLIREAEANMEQLYRRVEARARGQRPPEVTQRPGASPQPQPPAQRVPQPQQPAQPLQRPQSPPSAAVPPPQAHQPTPSGTREGPQAISLQDRRAGSGASSAAPVGSTGAQPLQAQARPATPGELPVTPGLASSGTGAMKLSEFIQIIRENWGLSAKQAMDLLQVKSLNNMNYRDLLRQLEPLVEQPSAAAARAVGPSVSSASPGPARPAMPASTSQAPSQPQARAPLPAAPQRETGPSSSRPAAPQATQAARTPQPASAAQRPPAPSSAPSSPSSQSSQLEGPPNIPVYPLRDGMLREPARIYKFDEEDEEQDDLEGEEAEGGAAAKKAEEDGSMSEAMARIKIDELREMRGSAGANTGRLVVLHNLLDSQISDEQFLQLIEGLWHTVSDKKLKQDQVEALISWAKEDYFEDEVRAVLAVLKERA